MKNKIELLTDAVNSMKSTPQEILKIKENCRKLENNDARCERIDGSFYFTESLVNKLMTLTALIVEERHKESYKEGYEDCRQDMIEKLGGV